MIMTNDDKKIKITFAPGFFDNFDGTQEELDNLVKELQESAENGDLNAHRLSEDEIQDLPPHILRELERVMDAITEEGIDLDALEAEHKKRLN